MRSSKTIQCHVDGRVQGVWFRAGTREQALALGIDGYARNLPDGRVEVVARGNPEDLEALRRWLREGTPGAEVTELHCEEIEMVPEPGFLVR